MKYESVWSFVFNQDYYNLRVKFTRQYQKEMNCLLILPQNK